MCDTADLAEPERVHPGSAECVENQSDFETEISSGNYSGNNDDVISGSEVCTALFVKFSS